MLIIPSIHESDGDAEDESDNESGEFEIRIYICKTDYCVFCNKMRFNPTHNKIHNK